MKRWITSVDRSGISQSILFINDNYSHSNIAEIINKARRDPTESARKKAHWCRSARQSSIVVHHHRINDSCRLLLDANIFSDWSSRGGSSAEGDQNAELNTDYLFCSGKSRQWGRSATAGRLFLAKLGRCAKFLTCDPRETDYFFSESVSVAVQRFNAVSIAGTCRSAVVDHVLPR